VSRPKAWNGTQWVDPSFWTGSQWKTYIPAEYNIPCQWTFDTAPDKNDGWYYDEYDGDAIWRDNGGGGLLSGANVGRYNGTSTIDIEAAVGHTIQLEALTYWDNTGGSSDGLNTYYLNGGISDCGSFDYTWEQARDTSVDSGWLHIVSPVTRVVQPYTYGQVNRTWSVEANQNTADFSGPPYLTGRMGASWFRFWDLTTGQVLMAKGNPGWEPKVKRSDGTWK
jgi:hypothetical protein